VLGVHFDGESAYLSFCRVALDVLPRNAQFRVPDRSCINENLYRIDPARATHGRAENPAGDAADGIERQIDGAHDVAAGGERVGATENARAASNGNETTKEYRSALASNDADGA